MLRDRLSPEQQADLNRIDAWWRNYPQAFNAAFETTRYREDKRTALQPYAYLFGGKTPKIPRSHWWWW